MTSNRFCIIVFYSMISRPRSLVANHCTEPTPWIPISNICGRNSKTQQGLPAPAAWRTLLPESGMLLRYWSTFSLLTRAPTGDWQNAWKGMLRWLRATARQRLATMVVANLGYLPGGRKAPERATPRGMSLEEVGQAIAPELERMVLGLEDCERRFGARTKITDHPFLGPLTANQWRKFHWIHGRHHARQIRERMGKA